MTEQPDTTTDRVARRAAVAQMARNVFRNQGGIITNPPPAEDIIKLASWICEEAQFQPPMMLVFSTGQDEPIATYPEEPTEQDTLTHKMLIEFTYEDPISPDTVNSICQAHAEDEGLLRVRGTLVP